jgi:hypothetical protein
METGEFWIAVIGSFFLFVGMPTIIGYFSYQEKKLKLQRDLAKAGGEGMRAEVDQLRERVRVLERLATDGDRKLAGDIERLRRDEIGRGA